MILAELKYSHQDMVRGYANRTLSINLTTNEIRIKPVSNEMKEKFIGGKGFDLWLMWNSLPKDRIVKWNDPPQTVFRGKRAGERHHAGTDIQCFPKGTMISTESGQKPIEEIKIGDSVHSHWGLQKVVETHRNHYRGKLIGVKLLDKTIWLTPRHKICLEDGGWEFPKNLKTGDKLIKLNKLFSGNFFHKEIARNIKHPHPHLIGWHLYRWFIGVALS